MKCLTQVCQLKSSIEVTLSVLPLWLMLSLKKVYDTKLAAVAISVKRNKLDFAVWSVWRKSLNVSSNSFWAPASHTRSTCRWEVGKCWVFFWKKKRCYLCWGFFVAHFWSSADSCSWMWVHPAVTDPASEYCAQPACTQECECAFWHFKKLCGGNVKSQCVRVCAPCCSLGRQCVPCHCASKHTQLPEEKAGPLPPSPLANPSQSPPPPRHSSRSLTRSPVASCCPPVNIYSPLCAGTDVVGRGQRRKPGFALTKCSCSLKTWMICCQEQEAASGSHRGRVGVGAWLLVHKRVGQQRAVHRNRSYRGNECAETQERV